MKRRQFVLGLGAVTASGATLLGSGAFTSVRADRTISVETAQDSEAFLELDALGLSGIRGGRSGAGNTVAFEFPSLAEQEEDDVNPQNPQGLGRDSVYRFASDVDGTNGLFLIRNNGTQRVDVFAEQQKTSGDVPEIDIFDVETGDLLTSGSPGTLDVGTELDVGFRIDTMGVETDEHDIDLTIVADA
jgi:hypothetical protein